MTTFNHEIKTIDIQREIRDLRRVAKKIGSTKESARRFLISAGIYTKSGKLRRGFR